MIHRLKLTALHLLTSATIPCLSCGPSQTASSDPGTSSSESSGSEGLEAPTLNEASSLTSGTDGPSTTTDLTVNTLPSESSGGTASDSSDSTSGPICDDLDDAPSDETDPPMVGPQQCPSAVKKIEGVLHDGSDIDWYTYRAESFGGCHADHTITSTTDLLVCVYAECDVGVDETAVFCSNLDAVFDSSPHGRPGCCNLNEASISVDCSHTDFLEASLYIRVSASDDSLPVCADYTVGYAWTQ